VDRRGLPTDGVPPDPDLGGVVLPTAGELAALARWRAYLSGGVASYARRATGRR
jgi:deoxyribodipyrimidine photo-lyase